MNPPSGSSRHIRLLLHSLQSPVNVGSILRVAETFATCVDIWDPHRLFLDEQKCRIISDFSCGAYARKAYHLLSHVPNPTVDPARHVAACLQDHAVQLPNFTFKAGDVVALGNEYDGLPSDYVVAAEAGIRIPMADVSTPKLPSFNPIDSTRPLADPTEGSPVLSVAMTAGIICYAAWLGRARGQ